MDVDNQNLQATIDDLYNDISEVEAVSSESSEKLRCLARAIARAFDGLAQPKSSRPEKPTRTMRKSVATIHFREFYQRELYQAGLEPEWDAWPTNWPTCPRCKNRKPPHVASTECLGCKRQDAELLERGKVMCPNRKCRKINKLRNWLRRIVDKTPQKCDKCETELLKP